MDRRPTRRWKKKELQALSRGAPLAGKYKEPRGVKGSTLSLGPMSRMEMRSVLRAKFGDSCCWCGELMDFTCMPNEDRFATIEHMVRLADGGSNKIENLRLACRSCNNRRHD